MALSGLGMSEICTIADRDWYLPWKTSCESFCMNIAIKYRTSIFTSVRSKWIVEYFSSDYKYIKNKSVPMTLPWSIPIVLFNIFDFGFFLFPLTSYYCNFSRRYYFY